ncbi:hypothetical protein [Caldivirga maquilingensis]|uniref:Uncharacterized protein n=1 Tax=Caldivirga maquilingensis (strain ATCC 700844 / DSM 13496 / JCM 10307 / IC-167) TaxID=397948 RepID=A8MDG3_CALMQ|nr:hypothetical protein [Caldivirga maquilingensis]ABW01819.1 hypothetical protein Cmaq_0988 [Caldivirga maquilingensis IC-167]
MRIKYLILIIVVIIIASVSLIMINVKHTQLARGRIFIWIEPWIPNTTIPKWALAGIVTVYYCSGNVMCLETLNNSLALVKYYLGVNHQVFIALYPTYWTYRGGLNNPVYFNYSDLTYIVNYLKTIDPSGKGLYVGFSEQWGCLYNKQCFNTLAQTYRWLEAQLPEAQFYYYDCCVDPVLMINFAKEANITILGYDIYSYVHVAKYSIIVNPSLMNNIKTIKDAGFKLIIGEIGFRVCDANAWYSASQANPGIPINWNCTAPAVYLAEVLNQVSGLKPVYIGIWVWNDCCGFGIDQNPLMVSVLRNYTKGIAYYPSHS